MLRLENKIAIVTGASQGIGRCIAETFAREGAKVIAVDMNKLPYENKNIYGYEVNVTDRNGIKVFFDTIIEKFGRVDILVNNAGITKDGLILRMKEEDFDSVIDVNLKGVFNATKAASGIMMKQRYGKIINISSVVGISGNVGQCNYAASKAGVIGFSKSIARELATRNVNVNVVAPGYIKTDMTKGLPEKVKESIIQSIPMKKIGEPKEVANLVLFLASDLSNYITGQVISVDGGMVMN